MRTARPPYSLPALFVPKKQPSEVEYSCQFIIRASWKIGANATDSTRIKAARDAIAGWQPTPAELDAMARGLGDYTARPLPSTAEEKEPVDWLYAGSGCTERTGTVREARSHAYAALVAVLSILVEVPVGRCEDETALLSTLLYTRCRLPFYQRQRVARRMARHLTRLILHEPFVAPTRRAA